MTTMEEWKKIKMKRDIVEVMEIEHSLEQMRRDLGMTDREIDRHYERNARNKKEVHEFFQAMAEVYEGDWE